ncbi:hypothetical protein [Ideonella oryzae]|uniref:Uncharacterized protein n=1 Tax=Ideonella oryzae TaxID=2937441 RepID=A0ABT1BJB9_9BURK|nr:hypothetical protein [Ideonella oryzae]MCO5976299.1 hypothetical protein [Ideonella oryzae]
MSDTEKTGSWWQTLPGVLTALAAVITAVSGLVALFVQHGGGGEKASSAAPATVGMASPGARQVMPSGASPVNPAPTASPIAPAPAPKPAAQPWSQVQAAVVGKDGRTTRVRAETLSNCISVNHELTVDGGQSISFEHMAGFEVLRAERHTSSTAKAQIKVTLLNGDSITGMVEANCDLFGENEVGRFSTFFDQIRSVHFEY